MNISCVVTIDTECDRGKDWRNILPIRYTSVTELIPGVFQKIFNTHHVKPTYLLSPEVLESKDCVQTLKSLSNVELGSHLHGEFVGPDQQPLGEFTGEIQAMYSPDVEKVKLSNLTRLFEEKIGFKPKSFRAGRWGLSPHTFKILEDLGYLVDSSVTPYFIWKFPDYCLDYRTAPDAPYFPSADNFMAPGKMRLLQVPVTIYSQYGWILKKYGHRLPVSLKKNLLNIPLWRPLWLRPTNCSFSQMKNAINGHIASHAKENDIVLNMMFHSVEILPQDNPYGLDQGKIGLFLDSMQRIFEYLHTLDASFLGLSDIYPIFEKVRGGH